MVATVLSLLGDVNWGGWWRGDLIGAGVGAFVGFIVWLTRRSGGGRP
jgi:hypothetical protein